jgi:hypothetical protein
VKEGRIKKKRKGKVRTEKREARTRGRRKEEQRVQERAAE